MALNKLINVYQEAMGDYEAAKAGVGNRVETFTRFLVAEKALATGLARAYQRLDRIRTRYSTPHLVE
jgi:hypothetical protein